TVGSYLPVPLRPYLAVLPALCFVFALVALRHSQETPPDGVLYKEQIRMRQELETRRTELSALSEKQLQLAAENSGLTAELAGLKAAWRGRRLSAEQKAAIATTARRLLDQQWVEFCTDQFGGVDRKLKFYERPTFTIRIATIGDDAEVLVFRHDIKSALLA